MLNPEPELNLDMIDFEWVSQQKKPKIIKKAMKILEEDGNHFPDLQKALQDKLEELDPAEKTKKTSKVIDPEVLKSYQEGVFEWEEEKKKKEAERERLHAQQQNSQNIFETDVPKFKVDPNLSKEQRAAKAEAEKTKGNEALKSGDLKEALTYYSKSIQYNDKAAATFSNRSLVYLRLKDYKSCISDADKALQLQPNYTKALHRRGKAYFHLNNYQEAIKDFQQIMNLEPDNDEVNADLMETRKLLDKEPGNDANGTQAEAPEKKGGFKKIAIQEEDESDEEDKPIKANPIASGILEVDRIMDTAFIEKQKKELEEKLKNVDSIKAEGTQLFKNSQYETAIKKFETALHKLNEILLSGVSIPAENDVPNQKGSILNNIALCYAQMDLPSRVVEYSGLTIDVATNQDISIKAYVRRALAYEKLDKLVLALHDYESVKNLQPDNKLASEGLNRIHQLMKNDPDLKKKLEKSREEKQKEEAKKAENEKKAAEQKPVEQKPVEQKPAEQKPVDEKILEKKVEPEKQPPKQEKSTPVQVDHAALEAKKTVGNDLFKQKNLPKAKESFVEIVNKVEQYYNQNISQEDRLKLNTLYVAVLSNTALVAFNLNDFEESLKYCEKALVIDSNHSKCLYRKALNKIKISDQLPEKLKSLSEIDVKQEQVIMYEESRKILEALLKTDNKNEEVKNKLSEVVGIIVRIRKNFNLPEKKEVPKPKPKVEEVFEEENKSNAQIQENKPKVIAGIKTEQLEKVKENVIKIATEELIQSVEIPENRSQLELNCKTFKNQPDKLFAYIKKIPADKIANLYANYPIDPDFVMNIVKGMKATGLK